MDALYAALISGDADALYADAIAGDADAISKLETKADTVDRFGRTILHNESINGNTERVRFILRQFESKNLLIKLDDGESTALDWAALYGHTEVVELLIDAARHLPPSSANNNPVSSFQDFLRHADVFNSNTALHYAAREGHTAIAKLLVEADPSDKHIQNYQGKTPIYLAAENGFNDIIKVICTTCTALPNLDSPGGSTTVLHVAIKNLDQAKEEDKDVIHIIINAAKKEDKSFDKLFKTTDEKRCTILELAVERNYVDVVELILEENPAYRYYGAPDFIGLMPLIYRAIDKEYTDIVKLLTERYEDRVLDSNPFFGPMVALISAIRSRKKESVCKLLDDHGKELVTFADNLGWTALHHAAYHEFDSIIYPLIEAQKKFEHQFLYEDMVSTPFHVAAEKGNTSTVILLMQLWPSSSSAYTAVDKKGQNILHLAALQSKKEMIQGILKYCPEKHKNDFVNKPDDSGNTPLHVLIRHGCFVPELMKYKGLDIAKKNKENRTPRDMLYFEDQIIDDQVQIKIALDDVQTNQSAWNLLAESTEKKMDISESIVPPSKRMKKDVIFNKQANLMMHEKYARMKEDTHAIANCFVDAIAGDAISKAALKMKADTLNESGETILHVESKKGNTENVRFILSEFANKSLLGKLDSSKQTALNLAACHGHTQVVEVLDAARHLPSSSANDNAHNSVSSFQKFIRQANVPMGNTALHLAVLKGNVSIVKLLVEADPNDSHVQNNEGKTPIYIAAENGYKDIVKEICTTCTALSLDGPGGSTTALHALIQNIGQAEEKVEDVIRMIINVARRSPYVSFEALFNKTDESGRTILELAVMRNHVNLVDLILKEDPAYQHGRGSRTNGLMRLIYKADDEEYKDIVELLSKTYETDGDKGAVALILAIKRRDEESIFRLLRDAKHLATFADDNGWTPLHYAAYHEFDSILNSITEAQKDLGYQFIYKDVQTPLLVAAERGYTSTVIRLMQLLPASSSVYTATNNDGRNILHLAAAENKKEMIHGILQYCPEIYNDKNLKQQDTNGDTPLHLLISSGCFIPGLIKHKGLDTMAKNKKNYTPRDMLYSDDKIIADQVQIKIALDDVQTTQSWKFWSKNMEKKTDILESSVLPSKRERKDVVFNKETKSLMDAKSLQMKKDLERYKKRTNTQIIVTALITTVTFTVGFTMPGGLRQSGEVDEGLVVLSKKRAFNAFMVLDALALLLSTSSLFFYFLESLCEDPHQVQKLNAASTVLNIVSVMAMMLTFIAGTYAVLSHSPTLAITVCVIGSLFFLLIIVLLVKIVYNRRVKRNED